MFRQTPKPPITDKTLLESMLWPIAKLLVETPVNVDLESLSPIHWHAWKMTTTAWFVVESGKGFHVMDSSMNVSWACPFQEIVSITVHPDPDCDDHDILLLVMEDRSEKTITLSRKVSVLELSRWHAKVSQSTDPILSDEGLEKLLEYLAPWEPAEDWGVDEDEVVSEVIEEVADVGEPIAEDQQVKLRDSKRPKNA